MRKLLPFFSLLLSLNIYASDVEDFEKENTRPSMTHPSIILGSIALEIKEGRSDHVKYIACFHDIVKNTGTFSQKEALKIAILLKEMGDERRYTYAIGKLTGKPISPKTKISLEFFSNLLGKPSAFEELQTDMTPRTPKKTTENPFYISPLSDDEFYNPSSSRAEKRSRIMSSPESSTNGNARKKSQFRSDLAY
jgi:hypothetical protein